MANTHNVCLVFVVANCQKQSNVYVYICSFVFLSAYFHWFVAQQQQQQQRLLPAALLIWFYGNFHAFGPHVKLADIHWQQMKIKNGKFVTLTHTPIHTHIYKVFTFKPKYLFGCYLNDFCDCFYNSCIVLLVFDTGIHLLTALANI